MKMPFSRFLKALGGVLLLAVFLFASAKVHGFRQNLPIEHVRAEALMVDPTLLIIISGEFKGLMADYLNLKAAVFKGGAHEITEQDWEALYTLFKQAMELDPYFFHTAYYTQGMLAWREGMHAKAVEILKINAERRDWDWEPKFYLGFDYFYYLKDNDAGAQYLTESSRLPNAPAIVASLAARLMQRSGQTLTAIAFLKTLAEHAEDESMKKMLVQRLEAHLGVYQLEQARDAYVRQTGHNPRSLEELVETGHIRKLPENTMGERFYYDPQSGEISFEKPR